MPGAAQKRDEVRDCINGTLSPLRRFRYGQGSSFSSHSFHNFFHPNTGGRGSVMTRAELLSGLYSHFAEMHEFWLMCAQSHGVGALVFFPEGYEKAKDFSDLECRFWTRDRLMDYLKGLTPPLERLRPEDEEFLNRMNDHDFLSVVVRHDTQKDRQEIEIHRIGRALLN